MSQAPSTSRLPESRPPQINALRGILLAARGAQTLGCGKVLADDGVEALEGEVARGTWDDFTDKYGFGDGAQVEERDYQARDILVALLNARFKEMPGCTLRAVAYDRPGMHNPVLLCLFGNSSGSSDEQLLKEWLDGRREEGPLPGDIALRVEELIAEAYEQAGQRG